MNDISYVLVGGIVIIAGTIRGITGFGGSMLMAPPLSLLIGPAPTVVIALVLEAAAAITMLPDAWKKLQWKTLAFLAVPALLTVPLGSYLLVTLDAHFTRRCIAGIVVVFSIAMLAGFRYAGRPRPATSVALGGISGILLGATSVGAPPVIIYLLSGPDPHTVTRANLIFFITVTSTVGLIALWENGVMTPSLGASAATLTPLYLAATWIGGKLFSRLTDLSFRRIALGLMLTTGTAALLS